MSSGNDDVEMHLLAPEQDDEPHELLPDLELQRRISVEHNILGDDKASSHILTHDSSALSSFVKRRFCD